MKRLIECTMKQTVIINKAIYLCDLFLSLKNACPGTIGEIEPWNRARTLAKELQDDLAKYRRQIEEEMI